MEYGVKQSSVSKMWQLSLPETRLWEGFPELQKGNQSCDPYLRIHKPFHPIVHYHDSCLYPILVTALSQMHSCVLQLAKLNHKCNYTGLLLRTVSTDMSLREISLRDSACNLLKLQDRKRLIFSCITPRTLLLTCQIPFLLIDISVHLCGSLSVIYLLQSIHTTIKQYVQISL
jgi:hypothetical protein